MTDVPTASGQPAPGSGAAAAADRPGVAAAADRPGVAANKPAIAAAGLGVLSVPGALTVILGVLLGLTAVVVGFYGVATAKRLGSAGQGLAVAGVVTGMLGMALGLAAGMFLV